MAQRCSSTSSEHDRWSRGPPRKPAPQHDDRPAHRQTQPEIKPGPGQPQRRPGRTCTARTLGRGAQPSHSRPRAPGYPGARPEHGSPSVDASIGSLSSRQPSPVRTESARRSKDQSHAVGPGSRLDPRGLLRRNHDPGTPNNDECNQADNAQANDQSGREQRIVSRFGAGRSRLKKCGHKPGSPSNAQSRSPILG